MSKLKKFIYLVHAGWVFPFCFVISFIATIIYLPFTGYTENTFYFYSVLFGSTGMTLLFVCVRDMYLFWSLASQIESKLNLDSTTRQDVLDLLSYDFRILIKMGVCTEHYERICDVRQKISHALQTKE